MNAPILVTGGAGFLGGWLVRRLLQCGERVRVLDLPQAHWRQLPLDRIEGIQGDICDSEAVRRAVVGCGAVFHLAGLPQLWVRRRGWFERVNYRGAVQVLDAAAAAGCRRVFHVSSATLWPRVGEETCRWNEAWGPYSRSKLRAERHALRLARQGAPVIVVSPTLPIGPGDLSCTPPTRLLLDLCSGKRKEYLDTRLNLIDVRDAAEAMVRALDAGIPGERYLLGNANSSFVELARFLAPHTGQPPPSRRVPYAVALAASFFTEFWADVVSGQAPVACVAGVRLAKRPMPFLADADLIRLGVKPRPLETTLAETVVWFREVGWMRK
jgi:nucleoside-diphosphate-sugar epimerase